MNQIVSYLRVFLTMSRVISSIFTCSTDCAKASSIIYLQKHSSASIINSKPSSLIPFNISR